MEDLRTSRIEPYDSLGAVFQLFATLSRNPELQEFSFLLSWPGLKPEEQRELYSKHACHELHFFLHEKDPRFFAEVVRPYLANKMHKTFLDHWLLGDDLQEYLEPWAFGRLNVVERILLAQRVAGEADATMRHVSERCDLLVPDPERLRHLFDSALNRGALEAARGLASKLAEARKSLEKSVATPPPPAARPAPVRPGREARTKDEKADSEVVEEREAEAPAEDAAPEPQKEMMEDALRRQNVRGTLPGSGAHPRVRRAELLAPADRGAECRPDPGQSLLARLRGGPRNPSLPLGPCRRGRRESRRDAARPLGPGSALRVRKARDGGHR